MIQHSSTRSSAVSNDLGIEDLTGNPDFSDIQEIQITRSGPIDHSEFSMTRVEEAFDSLYNLIGSFDDDESVEDLLSQ